ncbi:AIM24 family protein [Paenibacillus sp. MBLB4367]|uniref:AIM24 family protein n=1 Tax=Paenibacillus sp. MBLB4367 TaxID=3384767 RepID=UPI003907EEF7
MNITTPPNVGHIHITLGDEDALQLLHPKALLAYQGFPQNREDKIMDLAGMYRKKKLVRSRIMGPAELIIGLPPGCLLETIEIPEESDLLFDFRHVLFYSDGLSMKSKVQTIKNVWITREWVRMKFKGPGQLGLLSSGALATLQLDPERPLFVEAGSLVAYPENAAIKLSVYGNQLASQHMNVQWEITGRGPVLMQTGFRDPQLDEQIHKDGIVRRALRELLPFGGVYIR